MSPWPGYVDALSTLLMVLVFVLLVFVLAQAFLSVAISGRDQALDRLGRQVAQLADMLSLEKGAHSGFDGVGGAADRGFARGAGGARCGFGGGCGLARRAGAGCAAKDEAAAEWRR